MPALPPIKELQRISPSTYGGLLACPLRACLQADWEHPPLLRPGPPAQLGTVIHRLLELAGNGQLSPDEVGAAWNNLLADHESKLKNDAATAWMSPLQSTAFRFLERKLQALSKAAELAQKAYHPASQNASHSATELKLITADGKVGGRVDFLQTSSEGAVIKDYKTGAVFEKEESADGGTRSLKTDYTTQMELYAAIYQDKYGEWPARLELIPLSGPVEEVPVDHAKCQALLINAKQKLGEINAAIASNDTSLLAKAGGPTCMYCGFRPGCVSYRSASGLKAGDGWPGDIAGEIKGRSLSGTRLSLAIAGIFNVAADIHVHPTLETVAIGQRVEFYNLRKLRGSTYEAWLGSTVIFPD